MIVGIITARSGSRSIPNKNSRKLGKFPLLSWVVNAANNSNLIQKTIFSTDSEEYFKIATSINENIIFHKRTPELAEDVPHEDVLLDIVDKSKNLFNDESIIVLIQPTTPFVTGKHIDECIKKLLSNPKMNTCISVKQLEEHPEWIISKKNKESDIGICDISGDLGVRQNLPKRWLPNGGIYVMKKTFLEREKKIIDHETLIYEMPKINSLDIDEEDDFTICESLVKAGIISENN